MNRPLPILVALTLLTASAAVSAQEKPKGIFGMLDKLSKPGTGGDAYATVTGRQFKVKNFRHISPAQGQEYQKAMDEKNGFRDYKFAMSMEEFGNLAKEKGDKLRSTSQLGFSGPDIAWFELLGDQFLNNIKVKIQFCFYKKQLASVHIEAIESSAVKARAVALYNAIATPFGPGLVIHDANPKQFVDSYSGVLWYSDKMEVRFRSSYNPSELPKKADRYGSTTVDETGGNADLDFYSKDVLKDYSAQTKAKASVGI